jgi:hypothetical protein
MKTKIIMSVTLAVVLGGSAMWLLPHRAAAAETNAPTMMPGYCSPGMSH